MSLQQSLLLCGSKSTPSLKNSQDHQDLVKDEVVTEHNYLQQLLTVLDLLKITDITISVSVLDCPLTMCFDKVLCIQVNKL